jgi:CRP-like cAMP-binding protein
MRKALYFLGIFTDSDIDWLVAAGTRREIAAGTNLIEEGQPINSFYLIIDGEFAVRTAGPGGQEVARLMPGELIGEMLFVDRALAPETVQALDASFILDIPRRRLKAKLGEDAGFTARFYRAIARFQVARQRAADAALAGASEDGDDGEMDFDALDNVSMAGARFDWIQKRLRSG